MIGGEWTQSLAEIPSWRRGGQVVADYKYKEQVVAEKSKFIRTSTLDTIAGHSFRAAKSGPQAHNFMNHSLHVCEGKFCFNI